MCTANENGVGSCIGDDGGPLVMDTGDLLLLYGVLNFYINGCGTYCFHKSKKFETYC